MSRLNLGQWLKRHPIAGALVLAVPAGLALGWNWLAASGLLALVLACLACVLMVMCVFRLHGGRNKGTGATEAPTQQETKT